nr:phosphodiesterase [uncultured Cellulosilyticum sp.]
MRYMIISDIHGSTLFLEKVLKKFHEESYDYLIILGDILYHGPRNPIPEGHNPKGVVELLNPLADKIIACRGNCEAEVDQMLLEFPCLSDYSLAFDEGVRLFATHGHLYTASNFPKSGGKEIFLYGHTHLWELKKEDNILVCNPGSITLPKESRPHTYATFENGEMAIFTIEGDKLASLSIN